MAEQYCGTKSDVGFKAYDAILQTYFIDFNVPDEEQKDCALGKLLSVAEQFGESPCGKSPAAKPYLDRFAQIKSSVKTTIITKRLQLSMENEEKGTHKELVVCQSGPGGIAIVTGAAQPAKAGEKPTAGAKTPTQVALDRAGRRPGAGPHRRRQREPQGSGRAHRAQQRLRHLREAVPVRRGDQVLRAPVRQLSRLRVGQGSALERLAQPLPVLRVRPGGQGLPELRAGSEVRPVRAPQGSARVGGVAAGQRPAVHARGRPLQEVLGRHLGQAAGQRPGLLLRLQRLREGDQPVAQQIACLKDFIKKYDKQPAAGEYVVQAYMKQAVITERTSKNKTDVLARLQAGARRVHRPQAAGGHARGRLRRQGRLPDHGREVQGAFRRRS